MITVLSFGGGQDSTAILLKIIHDPEFRSKYVQGKLIVVMADTGNEHDYTYSHWAKIRNLCSKHDILTQFIVKEDGYHRPSWPDLITPQLRDDSNAYKPTMVQTGTKSCTLQLKIDPIYKWLDEYINARYQYGFKIRSGGGVGKRALKQYRLEHGKLRVLIGFASGEENRANKALKLEAKATGWQACIERVFPLIQEGMDRDACIETNEAHLEYEVMPSNCMLCPYQSPAELVWLYRNRPEWWNIWVEIEERKLKRFAGMEKNHGVYNSKKLLPQRLTEALERYGDWTDQQLHEYKKRHGCATNSF